MQQSILGQPTCGHRLDFGPNISSIFSLIYDRLRKRKE
ncbi:MAG: hypothetical protein ACJAVZ_003877 [Afipia broomeae]|jgi:hypothetical protein